MKVVYFDGYCNLCNQFVDFLIRNDRHSRLHYAPLQGHQAEKSLSHDLTSDVSTMAFQDGDKVFIESGAAIRTIATLGGIFSVMWVFLAVPRPVRDWVYRWVANHRYLWFGKRQTCRMPTAEERARFLN